MRKHNAAILLRDLLRPPVRHVGSSLIPEGYWCEPTKAHQKLKLRVLELRVKSEGRWNVGHADPRQSARGTETVDVLKTVLATLIGIEYLG